MVADMLRRVAPVAPVVVIAAGLVWGTDGALSAAFALGLVAANFAASAALLTWAARISLAFLAGAALFGFLLRFGLMLGAVLAVKGQPWVELVPLGVTLVVAHLGSLVLEARHVSATLAFPVLRPVKVRR